MKNTVSMESAIKTIARFWSLLSTIMILLFLFGEGLDPSRLTLNEWIGFAFFPIGLLLGLLISWTKELAGGIVTILSVLIFAIIMNINLFIGALAFPGLLFVIHSLMIKEYFKK